MFEAMHLIKLSGPQLALITGALRLRICQLDDWKRDIKSKVAEPWDDKTINKLGHIDEVINRVSSLLTHLGG